MPSSLACSCGERAKLKLHGEAHRVASASATDELASWADLFDVRSKARRWNCSSIDRHARRQDESAVSLRFEIQNADHSFEV
jgi:hypothetical protein